MFANRIYRIRKLPATSPRHSSQLSSLYPFTKLRAFPFQLSPEDAIVQMAPHASMVCLGKELLGSIGARFLPGFGFEPLRPVRITPVYFPGWIIDAEVSAEVSYENVQRTTSGIIHDSYLPGSDFRVLSWVSYFSRQLNIDPVPFTKDLEVQHGVEVSCLPYTISPFSALDMAHSMSYRDAIIGDDLRVSPKSITTNLLAAYPVLFPLYLAQYESPSPGEQKMVTLFIEAFEHKGRIRAERPDFGSDLREMLPMAPQAFVDFTHALDDVDVQILRGMPTPFFSLAGFLTPERRAIVPVAADWLNNMIVRHDAAQTLVEESGTITPDDDPRIRPFSREERSKNMEWMYLGGEIEMMRRVITSMKETHEQGRILVVGSKKPFPQDVFESTVNNLQSKIEELETKRSETTPAWWKEWLEMSRATSNKN
ncbi:hypothetical protein D9615_004327 [Tricholomella constricta]|uniref:Uncharacterized protein n=1 Tax=Tricholomella constricta TaxID=117010 RepID=A0A8H5HES4_9AGAR|nr:hypothetical protein D9615_004327 [Tricholomella constricta]